MYESLGAIAQNFGIRPLNIYKCKYYYVINTSGGSFALSAARPSKDRLEKIHYYKELIVQNGFYNLDSYLISNEGKPYYEYDGIVYTISRHFGSTELDMASNIQCMVALETIGSLHRAIRDCEESLVYAASQENNIIKDYERQLNNLYKIKKNITGSKKDFDIKLSKYITSVIKRAEESLNNLKTLDYGEKTTICHNSLKEGNIMYSRGKCRIIDWDNMKRIHFLEDTAFFMKRYLRKNADNKDIGDIDNLYNRYTKYNKLSQWEEDVLGELLKYPHRFAGLLEEYCRKNRGFVPTGIGRKLEECMRLWQS